MKYKTIIVFLAGLAISGCQKTEDKLKEGLIKHSSFYDPGSAMLRNIKNVSPNSYCIEINAKNRFGAYTGWRKAYLKYESSTDYFDITSEPIPEVYKDEELNSITKDYLNSLCDYKL